MAEETPPPEPPDGASAEGEQRSSVVEVGEAEIETNSLSGGELDELLEQARIDIAGGGLDGETARLSGAEVDRLLAMARVELAPDHAHAFADEPTVERAPDISEAAIATLPMPPSQQRPLVALGVLAPPLPAPARPLLPSDATPLPPSAALSRPSLGQERISEASTPEPKLRALVKVLAVAVLAAAGVLAFRVATSEPAPAAPATATVARDPDPPPAPKSTGPEAPHPEGARADAARGALQRLRDGIDTCVRQNAMVLPGSSPAVPSTLALAGGEGYASTPIDWKKPLWSCATFHLDAPMTFQLQWQLTKGSSEGLGVAWIDDDGDGQADRAFGFRAQLKRKGMMEAGEIGPLEPIPRVVPISY